MVSAEPRRAREGERASADGMGGGVDRGLADSPCCQHPSEGPGVTWEQGKTQEIQGRGRRRAKGSGREDGPQHVIPRPSSPSRVTSPPSPLHLLWMQMCDPAAGARGRGQAWWRRERCVRASFYPQIGRGNAWKRQNAQ